MRRTLFNLGNQLARTRGYCTTQLTINSNAITKFWDLFSNESREAIMNTIYEYSFQEVQNNLQIGKELMANRAKRDSLGALEVFEKTVKIADILLEKYTQESLSFQNRLILAQAYADYADVLYKCKIEEVETISEMVKKALELDPENEIAKELSFDMRFYDIVPEPPSSKL